ncbi:MAG: zinc ribbon domain-containing protein [Hespellia sp.]|nr:zinc ribbon domain-containing protein [Hespellia sp.]
MKEISLEQRRYICKCGMNLDRDLNAAINIRNKGYEMYCQMAA